MVVKRLDAAEVSVKDSVEAYSAGTAQGITKIQRRFTVESKQLANQWNADVAKFGKHVEKAKATIRDHRRHGKSAIPILEKELGERRSIYDQASNSIRSFQRNVMNGTSLQSSGLSGVP